MNMGITEHDVGYSIEYDIPQETSYACDIYVCEYAEKISRNSSITIEKKDSPKIRKKNKDGNKEFET